MHATLSGLDFLLLALLLVAWSCAPPQAGAQPSYPTKSIQMIVPYSAGGSIDIMARAVSQHLGETWGVAVLVDNRPGASGMIGTEIQRRPSPTVTRCLRTPLRTPRRPRCAQSFRSIPHGRSFPSR